MKLWQKFAAALTTATLLYGAQIRMWTDPQNRFLERWERTDALSLLAGIFGVALLFTVLRELAARHRLLRRGADHLFLLILGAGAVSSLLTYPDYKTELLFLGLVAAGTASWFRPQWQIPRRAAVVALIFSPLALILGNQLLQYPSWTRADENPESAVSAPANAAKSSPVFIFVFDEWSYKRSTENGEFLPLFKNLRELSKQAWTFDFAQSAGPKTDVSLPRFIWQRSDDLKIGAGDTYWAQDGQMVSTAEVPSLFGMAKEHGYRTALRGFYLPYRQMLGSQIDSCTSYHLLPKAGAFAQRLQSNGMRNLTFQHDPISRKLSKMLGMGTFLLSPEGNSVHWEHLNRTMRADATQLLDEADGSTFAFIHFPLPHGPFIYKADGTYTGPHETVRNSYDIEGYKNHLGYLDLLIGQFLEILHRNGQFDSATIVLTSDHSWRSDSKTEGKLKDNETVRHVPLFIKLPGQRSGGRVAKKFELTQLRPILDAAMSGHASDAQATLASLAEP